LAASAALNIYFYVSAAPSPSAVFHFSSRLIATIGMPSYTNATNISATYAVFFAGLMAALVQGDLPLLARAPIACAAAVLFVGVVLTDSRSAYVAIASTLLIVSATSSRRVKILVGSALMGLLAFALWRPDFREALLSRGSGRRFIVWNAFWSLIEKKPIFGYGSLDTTTGFTDKGMFLDQAHNLVLSAWFRGGVVSALAMLCILLGGIYWANRYRVATGSLVPLCMIVAIAAAGMFDYQLLTTYPTWPWATFWLPFGLCIGAEMATRSRTA
jgi:O-antigen ligase